MSTQKSFTFDLGTPPENNTFRTIHYLGSKLRILDFIKNVVDEVAPPDSGVCDLFSGSGSVSQHLSADRKIVAVDIQHYSNVICSALLNPINDGFTSTFVDRVNNSGKLEENVDSFEELVDFENCIIVENDNVDLELICDFIENCSLYSAINSMPQNASSRLSKALMSAKTVIKNRGVNSFLVVKYFGGLYFSFKQAAQLDAILECISESDMKYQNVLLASLLSTASDLVNTVGKQFAQPIRPRTKEGKPKHGIVKQLRKDRTLDVMTVFENWLKKYSNRKVTRTDHQAMRLDFNEALDLLDDSVGVVYADPPYTRDHYSRFYHGLETLCLGDHPVVSRTNIGGTERLSRGLYRQERHQSDFCIKSKAPSAFESLFKKIQKSGKILLLSYSPYDKTKGAHPRVVELELLESLASKYFKTVEIRSPGKFSHNKLNRTDLHLESGDVSEILLVCKD